MNTLCQCSNGFECPNNHRQTISSSIMIGTNYPIDNLRTYSGYCYPINDSIIQNDWYVFFTNEIFSLKNSNQIFSYFISGMMIIIMIQAN